MTKVVSEFIFCILEESVAFVKVVQEGLHIIFPGFPHFSVIFKIDLTVLYMFT